MSWKMVRLGDVCNIINGFAFKSDDFVDNGIPLIRISNIGNNEIVVNDNTVFLPPIRLSEHQKFEVKKGDILIALSGATTGKYGIYNLEIPSLLNQRIGLIRVKDFKSLSSEYFFQYLNYLKAEIEKKAQGAAQPNISTNEIANLEIPLPPLSVQQRIAEILDKADALRRKDQALLKKYDDLAQAIFMDMFGDPVKNEMGWAVKTFETLFDTRLGKMLDAKKQNGNTKYKYLGNSNVQWFKFNLNNLAEMEFDEKDVKTFELKKDDILICEGGEVGRAAIWKNEMQNVFFQKAIHRARVKTNNITPEFTVMLFWFLAKYGGLKDYVTTSTISHLTGEKLKTIPIPIPPFEQQLNFSEKIKALNKSKEVLEKGIKNSEFFFQSLLQQAFKGELV